MNLVTLSFYIVEEDQDTFVDAVRDLKNFWEDQGFRVSLFRDKHKSGRFLQTFLTEKTVDELIAIIQNHPAVKEIFEKIKDGGSRVVISIMEQLV